MRTPFFSLLVIAICCIAAPTNAQTILSDFLTFDGPQHTPGGVPFQGGGEDKLHDDSLTNFFDRDNSGTFTDGDQVVTMITLSEINSSGRPSMDVGANSQIAIVAMFEISGLGSGGSFNLIPVVGGLAGLLDASITGPAGLTANSVAIVMSTSTNDSIPANDPLNWTFAQISNGATGFGTANNWNWEMTVGLTPGTSDFAENIGSFFQGGTQRSAFTIESTAFNVDNWLPVDVLDFGGTTHLGDLTNDVSTFTIASQDEQNRGWVFRDHGAFFVNGLTTKTNRIPPEQLSILRGFQISGGLADVFESDDSYLKFNPGITLSSTEPPVWLEFFGTLPSDSPTSLVVTLEASANTAGLTQTIDAFNWNTGQYEQVDARAAAFNNDSVVPVDLTANIADYVESGSGAVKTRTGWRPSGPILLYPWTVCIDQVVWTVTE